MAVGFIAVGAVLFVLLFAGGVMMARRRADDPRSPDSDEHA